MLWIWLSVSQQRPMVPEADVLDRLGVGADVLGGDGVLGREEALLDGVQPERPPGQRDAVLDVWPLLLELVRLDLEVLDHVREEQAADDGHQRPGGKARDGRPDRADERADQDQRRRDAARRPP